MAERVGFEPTLPFRVNTLSKRAPSATRPSLRRESVKGTSLKGSFLLGRRSWRSRGTFFLFNSMGEGVDTATWKEGPQPGAVLRRAFRENPWRERTIQTLHLRRMRPLQRHSQHYRSPEKSAAAALSYCPLHDDSSSREPVPDGLQRLACRRLCAGSSLRLAQWCQRATRSLCSSCPGSRRKRSAFLSA